MSCTWVLIVIIRFCEYLKQYKLTNTCGPFVAQFLACKSLNLKTDKCYNMNGSISYKPIFIKLSSLCQYQSIYLLIISHNSQCDQKIHFMSLHFSQFLYTIMHTHTHWLTLCFKVSDFLVGNYFILTCYSQNYS